MFSFLPRKIKIGDNTKNRPSHLPCWQKYICMWYMWSYMNTFNKFMYQFAHSATCWIKVIQLYKLYAGCHLLFFYHQLVDWQKKSILPVCIFNKALRQASYNKTRPSSPAPRLDLGLISPTQKTLTSSIFQSKNIKLDRLSLVQPVTGLNFEKIAYMAL